MTASIATQSPKTRVNLTPADWLQTARCLLIESGIESVKVRRLAQRLKVTTGAFYWQYESLDRLHEDLLKDWAVRNTKPFTQALEAASSDGRQQLLAFYRVILLEEEYRPEYDNAVRDWSQKSPRAMSMLHDVDRRRIRLIQGIFQNLGFTGKDAEVRARVQYYHQVGYQAMRVEETLEERLQSAPYYSEIIIDNAGGLDFGDPEALRRMLLETPIS